MSIYTICHVFCHYRALKNVETKVNNVCAKEVVWNAYADACQINAQTPSSRKAFGTILMSVSPYKITKLKSGSIFVPAYKDICLLDRSDASERTLTGIQCASQLPSSCTVIRQTPHLLQFSMLTDSMADGSVVYKEVTVDFEREKWQIKVRGKQVDLSKVGTVDDFHPTAIGLQCLIRQINILPVCNGVSWSDEKKPPHTVVEFYNCRSDENSQGVRLRSSYCHLLTKPTGRSGTCKRCISWNLGRDTQNEAVNATSTTQEETAKETVLLEEKDDKDMTAILDDIFDNVPDQMRASRCPKNRRRWSPAVIRYCLSIWVRSRRAYQSMLDSGVLKLPSGATLHRYKHRLPHISGLHTDLLRWMKSCADKSKVPPEGRSSWSFNS